jgi:dipeptidyl aminopeptidase/acylaminoacyl peptidase
VARRSLALLVAAATTAALAAPAQATFPGRNGEIFLTQNSGSSGAYGEAELLAIDPRLGGSRSVWRCQSSAVPPIPECDLSTTPAISPDGSTLAVISLEDQYSSPGNHWMLTLIDLADGSTRILDLPRDKFFLNYPGRTLRWRGDGSGLSVDLYDSRQLLGPRVHRLLDLGGVLGPAVALPEANSFDCSTDGRVAFIYRHHLFVASPDGTRRRLTVRAADNPSWSPHGRWIAFERQGQIWEIPSRGGRPRRLTRAGGSAPAWSPDGRRIAFLRESAGAFYLYVLDPRGGAARTLYSDPLGWRNEDTPTYSNASPPEWQPLPR